MVKNKKSLEEELKEAKRILDFKVGELAYFTIKDGHTYIGTLLGQDRDYTYLKDVQVLDLSKLKLDYVQIANDTICVRVKEKTQEE